MEGLGKLSIDALVDQLGRTATEKARAAIELERIGAEELAITEEIRKRVDGRRRKKAKAEEAAPEPVAEPEPAEEEILDGDDLLP